MSRENCLEGLIGQIVADTALHARWLNTFSYLEYVGFRKIVKSQRADALTAAILGHACEEGRHALGLKKLAVKLGGIGFDSYAPQVLLCGEEAEAYFQDLDQFCDEAFADRNVEERVRLAYAYVTWLVERRALDVYGLYKNALRGRLPESSGACLPKKPSTFPISKLCFRSPIPISRRDRKNLKPSKARFTKCSSPL